MSGCCYYCLSTSTGGKYQSIYTVLIKAPPMVFLMGFLMFKVDCGGEVSQTYYI